MSENVKYYSEMERYEIININDGEKYNFLSNNDIIIDDDGYLRLLILRDIRTKLSFFGSTDFLEVPWEFVKKIGSKTIIIDVDDENMSRNKV